ncbi:hypothetical protein COOONC_06781 [Cooperia oncophora]
MSYEVLLERVGSQKHLLQFWDELTEDERESLAKQIESINFDAVKKAFDASANVYTASPDNLTPVPDSHHIVFKNLSEEERSHYWRKGLEAISRGEIAAIVLAGGQASRLGSSAPKGNILFLSIFCEICLHTNCTLRMVPYAFTSDFDYHCVPGS